MVLGMKCKFVFQYDAGISTYFFAAWISLIVKVQGISKAAVMGGIQGAT